MNTELHADMASSEDSFQGFDTELLQQLLMTEYIGRKLIYTYSTGSTMDDAKEYGMTDGSVVMAEIQTKGRGQGGHIWDSRWQGNIYASFILHRPKHMQCYIDQEDVEFAGSVAILYALQEMGLENVVHKWKNDVWCKGHKLAGSLVESVEFPESSIHHSDKVMYIYGVGINVNSDVRRHPTLSKIATSAKCELSGQHVPREKLFAAICNNLEKILRMPKMALFKEIAPFQLLPVGSEVVVHRFHDYTKLYEGVIEELRPESWITVVKDMHDIVHTIEHGVSLRPKRNRFVRVYAGQNEKDGTAQLIQSTLCSLLDTSVYDVNLMSKEELQKGDWATHTDLLVVGDVELVDRVEETSMDNQVVLKYVQYGGSVLGIAGGTNVVCNWVGRTAEYEIKSTPILEPSLTEVIHTLPKGICWCTFYSCNLKQLHTISDKRGELVTSAETRSGDVIAAHDQLGDGKIGLIGTNIELTYSDMEKLEQSQRDKRKLFTTVYQRDMFIQEFLKVLLPQRESMK